MPLKIKILVLDTNETDVASIGRSLQAAKINFEIKSADNKGSYAAELDEYVPNVILANYCIKDMDAGQALELKKAKKNEAPFILVTDKVDELFAVKMMKLGADDYLLKENLSKLPQTIKLALKQPKTTLKKQEDRQNDILQKSLARNSAFLNAIPDLIFVADRSGVIRDFQPSTEMEPFVSPEEFLGKNCAEVLPPNVAAEILKNIEMVLSGEAVPVHEYQLPYPDGIHDFECRYAAVSENEVLSIIRDITQHKQADQKILKEKELSESIINSLPGVFYLCNQDRKFLRWNKNWEEISGYASEEISQMNPGDFFDLNDRQSMSEKISSIFETGEDNIRVNFLLKTGKTIPYFFTGKRIDYEGQPGIVGIGLDLSELTLAQETLRKNEEKLRTLIEQASDGISIADENYYFVEVNNKFCEMLGYSREELLQLKMTDLLTRLPGDIPPRFNEIKQGDSTLFERHLKRKRWRCDSC